LILKQASAQENPFRHGRRNPGLKRAGSHLKQIPVKPVYGASDLEDMEL